MIEIEFQSRQQESIEYVSILRALKQSKMELAARRRQVKFRHCQIFMCHCLPPMTKHSFTFLFIVDPSSITTVIDEMGMKDRR